MGISTFDFIHEIARKTSANVRIYHEFVNGNAIARLQENNHGGYYCMVVEKQKDESFTFATTPKMIAKDITVNAFHGMLSKARELNW